MLADRLAEMTTAHASGGFDPLHLTPEASLNSTRLATLPGADARWVGRPAFELLSLQALEQLAAESGIGLATARHDIAWSLAAALAGQDQVLAVRAAGVVEAFGQRLGHLIATLASPAAAATGESAWRAAYLGHWAHIEQIWLGGGLVAGLGPHLLAAVRQASARLGAHTRAIELAPHPGVLALIGAARSRPDPLTHAVVLDFGHTAAKRGVATVRDRRLQSLQLLPDRAVRPLATAEAGAVEFVLDTLAETLRLAHQQWGEVDPCVVVSLASYVAGGRPADTRSLYAPLGRIERPMLEHALRERTGTAVRLSLVHDGTAAARGLPDHGRAGVILLGTSLGVGFPPPPERLLPVSTGLVLQPALGGRGSVPRT